ncbi:MAG: SufD family Fe-S cluster assembly protein, partial [Candidatus Poseidonia sp.]|nr:SufD family Fe-S cluster assembly protein [Poseidonia sp.]
LWRYTPWARIHPSKVDQVPEANGIRFKVIDGGKLVNGAPRIVDAEDIGRVFLSELGGTAMTFESNGEHDVVHVQAVASGHVAVGHLHLSLDHDVAVILHLSGEADWTGLHITGEVASNVRGAFGFVNELASNGKFLHCEDWSIARDATLELGGLSLGGFRCKSDIRSRFTGSGATLAQAISAHGTQQRHVDHHIEIHHDVPHTDSSLNIHAACDEQSHAIGTGLLTIAKEANHCDAGQVFKNLLLSEKARAESIPELEVLADEVSAAHGAASAPVNPDQLHYLMSRGLDEEMAVALLIEGFMHDGFSTLKNQALVDELRTRLTVHLECELKR